MSATMSYHECLGMMSWPWRAKEAPLSKHASRNVSSTAGYQLMRGRAHPAPAFAWDSSQTYQRLGRKASKTVRCWCQRFRMLLTRSRNIDRGLAVSMVRPALDSRALLLGLSIGRSCCWKEIALTSRSSRSASSVGVDGPSLKRRRTSGLFRSVLNDHSKSLQRREYPVRKSNEHKDVAQSACDNSVNFLAEFCASPAVRVRRSDSAEILSLGRCDAHHYSVSTKWAVSPLVGFPPPLRVCDWQFMVGSSTSTSARDRHLSSRCTAQGPALCWPFSTEPTSPSGKPCQDSSSGTPSLTRTENRSSTRDLVLVSEPKHALTVIEDLTMDYTASSYATANLTIT